MRAHCSRSLAPMAEPDPDCIFCKIVAGELSATVVAEDERTIAFMDINPAADGHLLVVPRAHSRDVLATGAEDLAACAQMAQRMGERVKEVLGCSGFNLLNCCGADAWQTVFHVHFHVIPRNAGDPLRLPWDPKPGDPGRVAAVGARLRAA